MFACLLACLLAQIQNFENFKGSQKFQNENIFRRILSNFDFFTPDPLPENEITPDLA